MMKRIKQITLIMVLIAMLMLAACGEKTPSADIESVQNSVAESVYENAPEPITGSIGGEWSVIALARSDYGPGDEYYDKYYENLCKYVKDMKGDLSGSKFTEYARPSMALAAIGKNPEDVEGYDLMKPAADFNFVKKQGINGPVFALIAANMCGYKPVLIKEDEYIEYILSCEIEGGGFSLEGSKGSPYIDITAMVVQALSFYIDNDEVKEAVDRAVDVMADMCQKSDGYDSSESISQTIIALTAAGIDPVTDDRFAMNGKNLVDVFCEYKTDNNMFEHEKGEGGDTMATEQALCALDAVVLYKEGTLLYEKGKL